MARRKPRYQIVEEARERLARQARDETAGRRVPADPTQHAPHNSYGPPILYYEDREFTCRDCGAHEIWTALQQKWWYEVAKGSIYSMAVRCRACRQARRRGQAGQDRQPPGDPQVPVAES